MAMSRTFLVGLIVGTLALIILLWMYYMYRKRLAAQLHGRQSDVPPQMTEVERPPATAPEYTPVAPQVFTGITVVSGISDGPPTYEQAMSEHPPSVPHLPKYEDAVRHC